MRVRLSAAVTAALAVTTLSAACATTAAPTPERAGAGIGEGVGGPGDLPGWRLAAVESWDTLDPARWLVRDRGFSSNEDSYLLARNVTVLDGLLRIQAKRESVGGRSYTSGYLIGRGDFTVPDRFRVEVRAKVPQQQGMWAAPLWHRPVDSSAGEIDVVETLGSERGRPVVHQTIHTGYDDPSTPVDEHRQDARSVPLAAFGDPDGAGWHVYAVEKTAGRITMFVDGRRTSVWRAGSPPWFEEIYDAGKRWDIRLNLQVGGSWGGPPDATTDWSGENTTMLVDYVHVWVPA